jgi:predicted TIM-barrel fold metal-dependent hydrolase
MLIDSHIHVYSYPSFQDLSQQIRTMEDAIAFRTRYPEIYNRHAIEEPVDNTDALIGDLDKNNVDFAIVQARPGHVTNDLVAEAVKRHPNRMVALARVGHDQEAYGYLEDPGPAREQAPAELDRALSELGMKGIGEIFARALTDEIHPEKIAKDLSGIMKVAEKHNVPIQFPTAWTQFPGGLFYGDPLWVDEVAGRHPTATIILTKMGRGIQRYFDAAMTVAMRNVNVYLDVVGTNPQHLRFALDKLGPERILFGTDWSATWRWLSIPGTLYQIRMKVIEDAKLSNSEREQVLWKNAARLFKLEPNLRKAGLLEEAASG